MDRYLLGRIVGQVERSRNDWREGRSGNRTLDNKKGALYDKDHLKSEVVAAAARMEEAGWIKINWGGGIRGSDFTSVSYRLEDMPFFYKKYQEEVDPDFRPRYHWVQVFSRVLEEELSVVRSPWIKACYREELERVETQRNVREKYEKFLKYQACFRGIDSLEEPVFKRIFSRSFCGGSKVFESVMQKHVIWAAKKYCEDMDDTMDDTTVLSQLLIEDYAQELAVKGVLDLAMPGEDGGRSRISTENWKYGTVLNSETMKHAEPVRERPAFSRVVTIENKANYVAAPFRRDTLYIFTHGFLSPRERRFLQKLYDVWKNYEMEYYHSGDLDYGGMKIFQYMRNRIFPGLQPLRMDAETFVRYEKYGEKIEEETLEKIRGIEEPCFQPLIQKILETGLGIEQESFLIKNA